MGAFHWERTPLGLPRAWPATLRTLVRWILSSRDPLWISWGAESTFLYNDACAATALRGRHPSALGRPTSDVWGDVWPRVTESAGRTPSGERGDAVPFLLPRNGAVEEGFFSFSCTSVPEETDSAERGGSLWRISDETEAVIAGRRASLLHDLASDLPNTVTEAAVLLAAGTCLDREPHDLPYTMVYLMDGTEQRLAASTGLTAAQMTTIPGDFIRAVRDWCATTTSHEVVVEPSPPGMTWAAGPWHRPSTHLAMAPLVPPGRHMAIGSLIAGLNPHRPIDPPYQQFVTAFAALLAAALGSVQAREADRVVGVTEEVLASWGHELRAPLNAILTWAQLLSVGVDADERQRGIETIERSARVQARLLDDLLTDARTVANDRGDRDASPAVASEAVLPEVDLTGVAVLVVDDDDESRAGTGHGLSRVGAEVVQASSAREGLELLNARRVDLIVSDLTMPTVDGYSFLVSVRSRPKTRGGATPAIALSSRTRSIDRQRALRAGFQMYLTKPVETAELVLAAASLAGRLKRRSS